MGSHWRGSNMEVLIFKKNLKAPVWRVEGEEGKSK